MTANRKSSSSPFKPAAEEPALNRAVPLSKHFPGYRPGMAKHDLLAGLTVAALALPSSSPRWLTPYLRQPSYAYGGLATLLLLLFAAEKARILGSG